MDLLKQIEINTKIFVPCDTVWISYRPAYVLTHLTAHSVADLNQILQNYSHKTKCIVVCSQKQKGQLNKQIGTFLEEAQHKSEGQRSEQEQLIECLSDSGEQERINLGLMLEGILNRTERKVRQSKIQKKMMKIDEEIKRFQELQAKPQMQALVATAPEQYKQKPSKKERKKQKGFQKKLEKLICQKEKLQQSKNGVQSTSSIEEILEKESSEDEVSDLL